MSENIKRTDKFKKWLKEYWWLVVSPAGFILSLSFAIASGNTKTIMTVLIMISVTVFTALVFTIGFWLGQINVLLSRIESQVREVSKDLRQ